MYVCARRRRKGRRDTRYSPLKVFYSFVSMWRWERRRQVERCGVGRHQETACRGGGSMEGGGGGVDPLWTGTATPHPTLLTQTSPSGARTSVCLSYSSYCSPLFPGVCCTATPVAYLPPLPPDSATLCFLIIFFFLKTGAQCVASSSSAASTVDDALPRRPALPSLHS